jgi:predicted GIY-YIG superfamily endonuclease
MCGYAGVYALYSGDTPYYTGLTGNLFGRLRTHRRDRHAGRWDHFVIVRIHRVRYVKDIETRLHALIDTRGNAVRGKVPKDADINRLLREELRNHKRKLRAYERALR